jgi:hypothetical protein
MQETLAQANSDSSAHATEANIDWLTACQSLDPPLTSD